MPFKITETEIPDIKYIESEIYTDGRGFFVEMFKKDELEFVPEIIQVNHSFSIRGVIRGLHYQINPKAQGKLVTVVSGKIYDVAVDIRKGSPWYSKFVAYELTPGKLLWIPPGFAHGFQAIEKSHVVYFITNGEYSPQHEAGILWNDPILKIPWPVEEKILSEKDKKWPKLENAKNNFEY